MPHDAWPDAVLQHAAECAIAAGVDGLRADLVMLRAARARAALEGRAEVTTGDIDAVAALALAHRQPADGPPHQPGSRAAPRPGTARPDAATRPLQDRATTAATPEGDWGALPPQPDARARVQALGGWPPKKA